MSILRPGVIVYGNFNGTLVPVKVAADGTLVTGAGGGGPSVLSAPKSGVLVHGNASGTLVPFKVSADGTLFTA